MLVAQQNLAKKFSTRNYKEFNKGGVDGCIKKKVSRGARVVIPCRWAQH